MSIMLHTPLKHIHPANVGGPHSSPDQPRAQPASSSVVARYSPSHHAVSNASTELNLADWLHVSPNQGSLMSPMHTHALGHAQVVGPFSPYPYAPSPSPTHYPSPSHYNQQGSSPCFYTQSPSASVFAPSGYGRNDFLAPTTSAFSTPSHAEERKLQSSPVVDIPRIAVSSEETDTAFLYPEFMGPEMDFSNFPSFASSHSAPLSPVESLATGKHYRKSPAVPAARLHQGVGRQWGERGMQEPIGESSPATTLTVSEHNETYAKEDRQTSNANGSTGSSGSEACVVDGQPKSSFLDKLRAASPVTDSAGSTPAPRSSLQAQPQQLDSQSQSRAASPSPFLAAPIPRPHANAINRLSCPSPLSPLSRGSSPLAELAELASQRSSAASSPLTPLPHSVILAPPSQQPKREMIAASALEKSLAEALAHQLPNSRPHSRPGSALSIRSTQSSKNSPSRSAQRRGLPSRAKRFPPSALRVSLPIPLQSSSGSNIDTTHLPKGPLEMKETTGYATRSRHGVSRSQEEREKKERDADLELIRLGSSVSATSMKGSGNERMDGMALDILASVSVVRRLNVETHDLDRGRGERWSRASSLTPLSSSVATPSPTVATHLHPALGNLVNGRGRRETRGVKRGWSEGVEPDMHMGHGKDGKKKKTTAKAASRASSASTPGQGRKPTKAQVVLKTRGPVRRGGKKPEPQSEDDETEVEIDELDIDAEGETVSEDEDNFEEEEKMNVDGDYEPSPASLSSLKPKGKKANSRVSVPKSKAIAAPKGKAEVEKKGAGKKRPAPRKAASARSVTASRPKTSRTFSSLSALSSASGQALAVDVSTPNSFSGSSQNNLDADDTGAEDVDLGEIDIPTRTFPEGVPVHSAFPLLYRQFPACSFVGGISVASNGPIVRATGESSPLTPAPATTQSSPAVASSSGASNGNALALIEPPSSGNFNSHAALGVNDLYTPRFVRGVGREKTGLCPICYEDESRGGNGKQEWLSMKFSAFNYHMQYFHGISPQTFLPFSPPVAFRYQKRTPTFRNEKNKILEGKCHHCGNWAAVEGIKMVEAKLKEIYWWKHAAGCHKGSSIPGECNALQEDAVLERVEQAYANMYPLDPAPKRA